MFHPRWRQIQEALQRRDIPAWLLYDFRGSNPFAARVLGLPEDIHPTRRWAVLVPAEGAPEKLVHRIEPHVLHTVEAREYCYATYHEWRYVLQQWCQRYRRFAVEYSPEAALPMVSVLDAGTAELLWSFGAELVSSADLLQELVAVVTPEQLQQQAQTAEHVYNILVRAFIWLQEQLRHGCTPQEYTLQGLLIEWLEAAALQTDHPPIVARTERAANPHYSPTREDTAPLRPGDLVLIDIWAKPRHSSALYADITWMAYAGKEVPSAFAEPFAVLCSARDRAVELIREACVHGRPLAGYEVDRHVRRLLDAAGYGQLFLHRTGHSLGTEVHGPGANLDDYETHDTRHLLPGSAVTVEPGVYRAGVFGMRTELDVQIRHDGSVVVCPASVQTRLVPLLALEESAWRECGMRLP